MNSIERAILTLDTIEHASERQGILQSLDNRAKLLVTIVFLVCVLSLDALELPKLIIFLLYPFAASRLAITDYSLVAKRSLIVLPFVLFIGIFNPFFHTKPIFSIFGINITDGWISFLSMALRGIIAAQAVIVLILSSGFYGICHAMRQLGIPSILANQLLFMYRYIFVLLQEALSMHRARLARGYGTKNYPFKMWGIFIGQLFVRTVNHSNSIHNAMLSRGFSGELPDNDCHKWTRRDSIFLILSCTLFLLIRFTDINSIL